MTDSLTEFRGMKFPVILTKEDDGYLVECPLFEGCFTEGDTVEEVLANIKEVIDLCLEESESRERARKFKLGEVEFRFVTVEF